MSISMFNYSVEIKGVCKVYYDACVNDPEISSILNANMDVSEVVSAIKKWKSGKPPGLDGIPVEFVKL